MRHPVLSALSITAAVALVAACGTSTNEAGTSPTSGAGQATASESAANDGPWEFSAEGYDNVTVKLDKAPAKVVADAYSMQAMWPYGVRPAGYWGYGQEEMYMKDLDVSNAVNVGKDGEFSLEKLAEINPDLLVGFGNKAGTGWTWWDEKVAEQATAVAPFLPIDFGGRSGTRSVDQNIEYYKTIAEKLGGDTTSDEVTQAKKDYEENFQALKKTLAERDDLTVALISPTVDKVYFGQDTMAAVKRLTDAGMKLVGPTIDDGPWAEASWEEMPGLDADVILMNPTADEAVRELDMFKTSKAAAANQVFDWDDKRPYTYRSYADWFADINDKLKAAKDVA